MVDEKSGTDAAFINWFLKKVFSKKKIFCWAKLRSCIGWNFWTLFWILGLHFWTVNTKMWCRCVRNWRNYWPGGIHFTFIHCAFSNAFPSCLPGKMKNYSTMYFQMAWLRKCVVTLLHLFWLLSTKCFQMCPQIKSLDRMHSHIDCIFFFLSTVPSNCLHLIMHL